MKKLVLILFCIFNFVFVEAQTKPSLKVGLQNFAQSKVIYPVYAKDNCIQGTVEIAFKVDLKGKITYAVITKSIAADLDKEALRIIRLSSGKWLVPPAYDTTALVHAPIKFFLKNSNCNGVSEAAQGLAIRKLHDQEISFRQVKDYYQALELGRKSELTEQTINSLKEQLGIDDDYINRRIAIAMEKLNQGDRKGACDDFMEIKNLGSSKGEKLLNKYCK